MPSTTRASRGWSASSELAEVPQSRPPRPGCCRSCTRPSTWRPSPDFTAHVRSSHRRTQRPRVTAEVHHGPADRCNVHAPERLRQAHRAPPGSRRGSTAGCVTATSRLRRVVNVSIQPRTRLIRSTTDSPPCGALRRIGQPDREVGGPHTAEHVAAPATAVQIGQPLVDRRLQAKEFRGLPGALLRPAVRAVGDAQLDGGVDLAVPTELSGSSVGNRPADIASVMACDTSVSRTTSLMPRAPLAPVLARPSLRSSLALA